MYLVFNKNGNMPKHVHDTEWSAKQEAERLARNHKGEEFFVFEVIASVKVNEFQWTHFKNQQQNELPF